MSNPFRTPLHGASRSLGRAVLPCAFAAAALAGCGSMSGMFGSMTEGREPANFRPPASAGLTAPLKALDSGVSGKVRVIDRNDGVTLLVSAINLPVGEYRVAFHERGNCSSPNGFSAGPAIAPPGRTPMDLTPTFSTNGDGTAESSTFVRGLHASGPESLNGKSVIIYAGRAMTDAVSGVPNNRVACGVFAPAETLGF